MLCAAVLLGACGGSRVPQQVASQGPATHVPQGRTPLFQYLYLEANREKLAGNYAEAYDLLRHCQVLR